MPNDFPQVVDISTLTGVFHVDSYLAVGVEGQKDAAGSAAVASPKLIQSPDDANTQFGPVSSLAGICKTLLGRGLAFVYAVASSSGSAPNLVARQAAWATLEDNPYIRVRLTDSVVQADLVALADSCEYAEGIQNKQFCVGGMAIGSTKAAISAAATAMASKRGVLVAPCFYDSNGTLMNGNYCAAWAAAEIAKNPDIVDSLNLAPIAATTGIEREATTGLPLFRLRANGGTPVNDFADLLTAGASPFMTAPDGRTSFTHLRTTYIADTTHDALTTLLIKDTVFLQLRDMLLNAKFLRKGNTATNRAMAGAMVDQWLSTHNDWVGPATLADGSTGYGVTCVPSSDLKSFTVNYFGVVVRGTNVININGSLTIPA